MYEKGREEYRQKIYEKIVKFEKRLAYLENQFDNPEIDSTNRVFLSGRITEVYDILDTLEDLIYS